MVLVTFGGRVIYEIAFSCTNYVAVAIDTDLITNTRARCKLTVSLANDVQSRSQQLHLPSALHTACSCPIARSPVLLLCLDKSAGCVMKYVRASIAHAQCALRTRTRVSGAMAWVAAVPLLIDDAYATVLDSALRLPPPALYSSADVPPLSFIT